MVERPEETIMLWPGGYAAMVPMSRWDIDPCCSGHPTPQEATSHGIELMRHQLTISTAAWRGRDT